MMMLFLSASLFVVICHATGERMPSDIPNPYINTVALDSYIYCNLILKLSLYRLVAAGLMF